MVDHEYIICPHCRHKHNKRKVIGTSGLINQSGYYDKSICCKKCGKDFYYDVEVILKIKTRKR